MLELLPVLAELLHDPVRYRRKSLTVYSDNASTVMTFMNQKCKKLYLAFMLESLNFVTSALQVSLHFKWLRRRSSLPMNLADDATHSDFSHAEPGTVCARHTLPPPLQEVLLTTTSYMSHTLDQLRPKIKRYLLSVIPDLNFPH